jgi:YD repeat-containing protein
MLVRETDPNGASFHYGYDGFGPAAKCVRTWGTGGRLDRVLAYDGATTRVSDGSGNVTTYRCDPVGLVRDVTDALGDKTRYRYDDALRLVQIVHADGTSVTDVYDARGNLVQRKGPGEATWRMRHDDDDRCVEAIDSAGGHWRYAYDGGGRLARVEDPLGHVTRLEYESARLVRIVDPLGRVTHLVLEAAQCVLELDAPGRAPLRFDYDAFGRMAAVVAAGGERIAWSYDARHRPIAVDGRDESVRFDRDASGHVVAIHRPSGTTLVRRDAFGTITAIEAAGAVLSCPHDDEGRLNAVLREGSPLFTAQYDPRGLVSVFTREDQEPHLVLRKLGTSRIECIVDAQGTTRLEWDKAGRIASIESDDGTTRQFSYRVDGMLLTASSDHGVCVFDRDIRGAVLRQRVGDTVLDVGTVDHFGRRHGFDVGDRVHVSYLRDGDGELERIAVVAGSVHDIRVERSATRHERISCEREIVEIHRDAWGRVLAVPGPVVDVRREGPTDALLRPLFDGAGRPLVWDEDRLLLAGSDVRVCDADSDTALAIIRGEHVELARPVLDPAADPGAMPWLGIGSDPTGLDAVCPTPVAVLERRFAYRAWNPDVRPVTGMVPWNPDEWTCRIDGPDVPDGRLDQPTLVRLLGGPFPRSGLRLGTP